MRRILLLGGSPRVPVDAVRYLKVAASGDTAVALRDRLASAGVEADLLLAADARPEVRADRYAIRADLEAALKSWIGAHPAGVVVMSAAINDYDVSDVSAVRGGEASAIVRGAKLPSGADEVVIRLRPAAKVIDQLRSWGLTGPIVAFKYEASGTVIASARSLLRRVGAALVVANSLCGGVQALIDADGERILADRSSLLAALADRLRLLAGT